MSVCRQDQDQSELGSNLQIVITQIIFYLARKHLLNQFKK